MSARGAVPPSAHKVLQQRWPRLFPNQRSDGGCFTIFEGMLRDTLSTSEQAVFGRMAAATLSAHYCQLALTLLPTSPEAMGS